MLNSSGVGVYLSGCLKFFLKSVNNFILLGDKNKLIIYIREGKDSIIDCNIKPFSFKEIVFFPKKLLRQINKADAFFSPFFCIPRGISVPIYTTIHDIIFPDMPEMTSRPGLMIRMYFYHRAYTLSKKIFTVSEFSQSRINYHLGNNKPVIVTYSSVLKSFLDYTNKVSKTQKNNTIVFIGNIKKNKGLDCLLEAFRLLIEDNFDYKLIIIGEKSNFRTADNSILLKIGTFKRDSILFTGYISDEILMDYISRASLLVQPSLYEGFCLPPLQALVLGTKALISDIPVLKEIYKDFPVNYFKAGDPVDLKNKMAESLSDQSSLKLTDNLLNKYNFEKTASIILDNINSVSG